MKDGLSISTDSTGAEKREICPAPAQPGRNRRPLRSAPLSRGAEAW